MTLTHTAAREGKLLSFLRRELGLSYGLVKRLKYQHAYRVNGVAAYTNHAVKVGDQITVTIDEAVADIPAEDGALSILYEDEAVILLDKPAGMIIHPTFHRIDGTLVNRLLGYYQRTGQKCAVHLVSRLDRDTFGVVMVAKNAHMHAVMCEHMQAGRLHKVYHAAVYRQPPGDSGEICAPIARLSPTSLLRCVREDGKHALSRYEVMARGDVCVLLRMEPQTGRTHQLRVHCAHEGFPILGDSQYGTAASLAYAAARRIAHQQLCAKALTFPHPISGQSMTIRSAMDVWWQAGMA